MRQASIRPRRSSPAPPGPWALRYRSRGMEGKRLREAKKAIEREKLYSVDQAVKLIKERAKAKFDETIEIAMNLGVDPRHADQMVRGVCTLPNGTGRTVRVAVF